MQLTIGLLYCGSAGLLAYVLQGCGSDGESPMQQSSPGGEYHFVAFAFKDGTKDEDKAMVMDEFRALKDKCMIGNKMIISDISAGTQNSLEKIGQAYTQAYMVKLGDVTQRDFYVGCLDQPCQEGGTKPAGGFCQAHDDFKVMVGPFLTTSLAKAMNYNAGVLVIDFTDTKTYHNVFFKFKSDTPKAVMDDTRSRFLKLKDQCEGIEALVSGDQNSKEGWHQQYQQGYYVVLSTTAARDVYVGCLDKPCQKGGTKPAGGFCQAHDDFKVFVSDYLDASDASPAPDTSKPEPITRHYHPGLFVFDFQATTPEA